MHVWPKKWLVFFACLLLNSPFILADSIDLTGRISYLKEKDRAYTIDELSSSEFSNKFLKASSNIMLFGLSDKPYWLKLDLASAQLKQSDQWLLEISNYKLNQVEVIYQNISGEREHLHAGIFVPVWEQMINSRNYVFPLKGIDFREPLYIKVASPYIRIPISLLNLSGFIEKEQIQILTDGIFYGIVFAILCYHFLIFLALRNRSYLHYAIFLTFVLLWFLSGQGWAFLYLFAPLPKLGHISNPLLGLAVLISGIQFTKVYLNLTAYSKVLNKTLGVFQVLILSMGVLGPVLLISGLEPAYAVLYNLGFLIIIIVICLCFYSAYKGISAGQVTAKYYLIATSLQFIVSATMIFSFFELIPYRFEWKLLQWSSIIEMLIFSFGLSQQVKMLETEKQRINEELLSAGENSIIQLETINKLKDQLLSKVTDPRLYPEFAKLFPVINKIIYIQALGNASRVVYSEEGMEYEVEIQSGLKDIEKFFDVDQFIRIHKTYLLRKGIKFQLKRRSSADYDLVIRKVVLPVGRKYAKILKSLGIVQK